MVTKTIEVGVTVTVMVASARVCKLAPVEADRLIDAREMSLWFFVSCLSSLDCKCKVPKTMAPPTTKAAEIIIKHQNQSGLRCFCFLG